MEKRYIVYRGQEDTGFYSSYFSDIHLKEKTIQDVMSQFIGIYKNFETVEKLMSENKSYYYQEIDWEV